ncbi:prevent-host-death family protein [Labrys okinawensis]|uniref:prevent-host-death family protein n=1 Tax=Labrys okinawensis TaxID=346911 RepID=UPI0039BD22F6
MSIKNFKGGRVVRRFSTVELARRISVVTHAAAQEPVEIMRHRKPKFVLMSMERYHSLIGADEQDPRRSFTSKTLPNDLRLDLLAAAGQYEREHADG